MILLYLDTLSLSKGPRRFDKLSAPDHFVWPRSASGFSNV